MIGTLWAGRADEEEKNTAPCSMLLLLLAARIARQVRFASGRICTCSYLDLAKGESDIGIGIIDREDGMI